MESGESTFCFLCLKRLRGKGRKGHIGGDGDQVKGQVRRERNAEINSVKILLTYLLNTGDNKHDSVLKLAGLMVSSDVDGDEQQNTPPRKCFRLCDKCEGNAGRILKLHLELEKVQMRIDHEVKTVREEILKSSGWLGGTGTAVEGMMNELEEEETFENFARRFLDADFSMKARGTFGVLKTFQTAVADIDKTAILVPFVNLERYATTQNPDLLSSAATGSVKTEPHDEDDPMEGCQDDAATSFSVGSDPGHSTSDDDDDNNSGNYNGDDFISSLDDDSSSSDYEDEDLDSVPQEDPKDTEYTPEVKKGPPQKKQSHSERLVQPAKRRRGRPPGGTDKRPSKKKSPSKNDGLPVQKRKVGRPIIGEGPNPLTRTKIGRRLTCETCSFKHRQIHTFEQHLRTHETEEKVFKCEKCDEGFSNEQNYRLHEGRHRGHYRVRCEVEVCHQRYFSIFQIVKHLKSHNEVGDQLFPCSFCSHILPSVGLLLGHLRKYHGDAEWKCVVCGEVFKKVTELGDHLQEVHQTVEKLCCGVDGCERSFFDPESLRLHKKVHKAKFGCPQCDKYYTRQETFDLHQEFHRTGKPCKCDLDNCSEAFPNQTDLRRHQMRVHHIERQVCEICGKECSNSSGLKGHMVTVHGVGEGKPCPVCNKLFAYSGEVRKHMEQAHSTAKNYICEDCGKAFKTREKCRNHRQIHGERTHQCPHCPLAFRQRPALLDHIRIHTGEKPYLCGKCGKGFGQSGTRKKHEKRCRLSSSNSGKTEEKGGGGNDDVKPEID